MLFRSIFGGVYFVTVTAIEMMGFGTDQAGVEAFTKSGSLMGDLGSKYIGNWIGTTISLGAAISAFGCALACIVGASRLAFALGRDGGSQRLAKISGNRVPSTATAYITVTAIVIMVVWKAVWGVGAFDIFVGSGVIGTLILIVAYVLATIGAVRFLFFSGKKIGRAHV